MHEDVDKKRKSDQLLLSPEMNEIHKRYSWDPESLLKKNKFYLLRNDQVSDAIPSTSHSSQTDQPKDTKIKIPPIFLPALNYKEILLDIKQIVKNSFTTSTTQGRIRINLTEIEDYRTVTKFYTDNEINYYTYCDPNSKPLSIVIKNIPASLTEEDIKTDLENHNLPILKITRLLNKAKKPTLVVAVDLTNNDKAREIFQIEHLCHAVIKIEPRKNSQHIPQCFRCQRFGHTKNYCQMEPRCVKCQENHLFKDCKKQPNTPPTCVNCSEAHPANYRGCKYYVEFQRGQTNSRRTIRDTTPRENNNTNQYQYQPSPSPTYNPSTTYASAARNQRIPLNQQIPLNHQPEQNSPLVEQILNYIMMLITPHIETIKNFLITNILPGFFNATK